jgi:hypothetical protein
MQAGRSYMTPRRDLRGGRDLPTGPARSNTPASEAQIPSQKDIGRSVVMCAASTTAKVQYPAEARPKPSVLLCWTASVAPRRRMHASIRSICGKGFGCASAGYFIDFFHTHTLLFLTPPLLRYACSWPRASCALQRPSPWLFVCTCVCVWGGVGV